MSDKQPLVSICIPIYNGERYLKECIESVKNQTYENFEIIIVDDGSSDNSISIVEMLLRDFENKHIYRNDKNLGLVANWEKSISMAKGEWIKFIFQDDIMAPECVSSLIGKALTYNVEFSFCKRKFIFEDNISSKVAQIYEDELVKPELIFPNKEFFTPNEITKIVPRFITQNVIGEPVCWLFHKNIFNKIGQFNKKLKLFVDYEFALRIILNNNFVFINQTLIHFRVHNNSTSIKEGNKKKESGLSDTQIRGQFGDILELINQYMNNNQLIPIKDYWSSYFFKIYFLYTYFRICKLVGEKRTKIVLNEIIISSCFKDKLKYSRIKYEYYKFLYKKNLRPVLNK